jgi:hypothetical protein
MASTFDLVPVIYDRKQQRSELQKLFEDDRSADRSDSGWSTRIMLKAVRRALSFKNDGFEEENEWRLVSARPFGPSPPFQYRVTRWGIMPYVEIPFDRAAIEEVWLGPALDHQLTERPLKMFIEHCGLTGPPAAPRSPYVNIAVRHSEIPLRSLQL